MSDILSPSSSFESSKSLHEEFVAASSKDTAKSPLKSTTTTDTKVNPHRFSRFSSQRKPRVIIFYSESVEMIVLDSESSDDDNVVLYDVLNRKVISKVSFTKESSLKRSKKPRFARPLNADKLYEELFSTSSSGHEVPSSSKVPFTYAPTYTPSSSKAPSSVEETIEDLFAEFHRLNLVLSLSRLQLL